MKKQSALNLLSPSSLANVSKRAMKDKSEQFNNAQLRVSMDYPWQILDALLKDLKHILDPEDLRQVSLIVRERSVKKLSQLASVWSPQCISSTTPVTALTNVRARLVVASLLKKFPFPEGTDIARKTSAVKKFIQAEISCRSYNAKQYKNLFGTGDARVNAIVLYAKAWIQGVIGNELPDYLDLTLRSRHGPGASTNTANGNTSCYFKYSEWPYDVTYACREFAISALSADERWLGALEDDYRSKRKIPKTAILNRETFFDNVLNVVGGNKIAFVPKSYETHRTIAIEPTMNLYLQLGVDGYIRKRLKRWLIDLDDQSRNQRFARLGSLPGGKFCTLDLSQASDSVATRLVRELLPTSWYDYLMLLRSPRGRLRDKDIGIDRVFTYEKISSMGNGYTFALESLIFAAISHAVIRYETGKFEPASVAVYGDDIIVPTAYAGAVVEFLNKAGFSLNLEKSFFQGGFRESCGADWFYGQPVRSVFLTEYPSSVKGLYLDRNRISRKFQLFFGIIPQAIHEFFEHMIPSHLKCYGPYSDTEYDTYIHSKSPSRGLWLNGEFHFYRIVTKTGRYEGKAVGNLLFRKLMRNLLPGADFSRKWEKIQIEDTGHAFTVQRPRTLRMAIINSSVDFWQNDYSHDLIL